MIDNLGLYYSMNISKNGMILKKYRKRKCHSFVKQFIQLLSCQFGSNETIKDTSNTNRAISTATSAMTLNPGATSTTYGSQVGTGTTAVTINDYKIETLIAHGTGAGQLQYSAVTFGAPATDATTTTIIVTRVFTNNSGNNVTVYEISIVARLGGYNFLIAHDILASPVTLANGEALTLNYSLKTTI